LSPDFSEKTLLNPPDALGGDRIRSLPLAKGRVRVGFFNQSVLVMNLNINGSMNRNVFNVFIERCLMIQR